MLLTKSRPKTGLSLWIMGTIAFALLFFRSRYGFTYDDEPFIVSLAQRLYFGDSLFIDEWNNAQNVGTLILPFYRLYIWIFQSTDGILLAFRGLYCFFWVLICTYLYKLTREKYKCAIVVYLYLLLFSPLDMMMLSYTSMCIMGILLIGCVFFRHTEVKPMKLLPFTLLFSAFTVISVICSPYLSFVYALYVFCCILIGLFKKTETTKFYLKSALLSVLFTACTLLLYGWRFMFNNYSISEFIDKLPNMFASYSMGSTVAKKSTSIFMKVFDFWKRLFFMLGICLISLGIPKVRKSVFCKSLLLSGSTLAYLYEMYRQFGERGAIPNFNLQMAPIAFFGFLAFFMLQDKKKVLHIFLIFNGMGLVYSLVSYLSSSTGLPAFSMGMVICGVGSIVSIGVLVEELIQEWNAKKEASQQSRFKKVLYTSCSTALVVLGVIIFSAQIFTQSYLKINRQYWDCPPREMNAMMTEGAAKGIYTLDVRKNSYDREIQTLDQLLTYVDMDKKEDIRFLNMIFDPDIYLNAELPVGSFSTWTYYHPGKESYFISKLKRYYSANPSKVPNIIFCSAYDDSPSKLDIDISDWTVQSHGGCTIYIAPEFVK